MTAMSGIFYTVPQKYNQPPENSHSSTYKAAQQTNTCGGLARPWWSKESHFTVPGAYLTHLVTEFGGQSCSLTEFQNELFFFFFPKHNHSSLMTCLQSSWTNAFFNSSTPNTLKWKIRCEYLGTMRDSHAEIPLLASIPAVHMVIASTTGSGF